MQGTSASEQVAAHNLRVICALIAPHALSYIIAYSAKKGKFK